MAQSFVRFPKNAIFPKVCPMIDYEKLAEGVSVPGSDPEPSEPERILDPSEVFTSHRSYLPLTHEKYQGIAEAKGYEQTENRISKVRYSHEAMIDILIAEPTITQGELAKRFGYSQSWVSIVMGSDAFQGALAKRRDDLLNPEIVASLEDRMKGLADQSLQVIAKNLEKTQNSDLALKALEITSKGLGFGARNTGNQTTTNNFVVQLPPKIADQADWAAKHAGPVIEG